MTAPRHIFTVVIASLCDDARGDLLKRACDSVRSSAAGHDYAIIVVPNGPRVSPGVLGWLAAQADWRVLGICESPITGPAGNVEFLIAGRHCTP